MAKREYRFYELIDNELINSITLSYIFAKRKKSNYKITPRGWHRYNIKFFWDKKLNFHKSSDFNSYRLTIINSDKENNVITIALPSCCIKKVKDPDKIVMLTLQMMG